MLFEVAKNAVPRNEIIDVGSHSLGDTFSNQLKAPEVISGESVNGNSSPAKSTK